MKETQVKMPDNMTEKECSLFFYNYAQSIKLELCGSCLLKLQCSINRMHGLDSFAIANYPCQEDRLEIDIEGKTWGPRTSCIEILAESILRGDFEKEK